MIKGHFTEAIYPKSEYLKQDFKIQETRTDTLGRQIHKSTSALFSNHKNKGAGSAEGRGSIAQQLTRSKDCVYCPHPAAAECTQLSKHTNIHQTHHILGHETNRFKGGKSCSICSLAMGSDLTKYFFLIKPPKRKVHFLYNYLQKVIHVLH